MNDDVFPPPDENTKMSAAFAVGYDRGIQSGGALILTGILVGIAVARLLRR